MSKETSKLSYVKKGARSLKTIMPMGVVNQLELKHGDILNWRIATENGETIVIVRKVKKQKK